MLYISLRQYEYIVGVADAGSLTQAAQRLNVSQPSLSVAITRVEQRLNQPIFLRGKGAAIEVTPFGHLTIAKAREVLALAETIEEEDPAPAPFVLGCFEDIAPWYLAPAVNRLKKKIPKMTFIGREARFSTIAEELKTGRMDLAISYDVGFDEKFNRLRLKQVSPVAFLSKTHPLAENRAISLSELARCPLILFEEHESKGFMNTLFERQNITPTVVKRVTSLEMMRSLAAHDVGMGVSYTYPLGDTSYDGTQLVTVPICGPQVGADISLIWSASRQDSGSSVDAVTCLSKLP